MGYATALGIADSNISLEQQVSWHFSSNCYPPVPQFMVPVAVKAIEQAIADEWDEVLDLPEGVSFRNNSSVKVYDIIDGLFLQAFVDVAMEEMHENETD